MQSGFIFDSVRPITSGGISGTLPAAWSAGIAASVISGALSTSGVFTTTNPETTLEAISPATYAAMTIDEVIATTVAALLPKTSGPLDAGGGNWFGALTQAGLWNDGSGKTP